MPGFLFAIKTKWNTRFGERLKNTQRAENTSFGTCLARFFRVIEHCYSPK
jgi:hypothetical protein